MKFKTTAIAMAVAGIVAAPVAVQAGADEVYASARVGIKYTDQATKTKPDKYQSGPKIGQDIPGTGGVTTGSAADFDVKSFASRFGMKGETDLGNGMSGFGRYEFGVSDSGISQRHLYVGVKGDFGSVLMGKTYHTFYNYVVGPLDNPWWHSTNTMVESVGRTGNGITYAGGAGAVSFGATVYMVSDAEETPADAIELGASFAVGDSTIGVGYRTVDEDGAVGSQGGDLASDGTDDVIAVAWHGIGIGNTTLGVSLMNQGDDNGIVVDWAIGNAYVHLETVDYDAADQAPMDLTLGYTQSLGRKTTMYYELNSKDADSGNSDDDYMAVMAVLKYDII
jgi:predicted porin